jgi:hypothetical protein
MVSYLQLFVQNDGKREWQLLKIKRLREAKSESSGHPKILKRKISQPLEITGYIQRSSPKNAKIQRSSNDYATRIDFRPDFGSIGS